ncbi:radical SAM family heme chaperone HemW [Pseudaestuariivita rosea]|uniref:radical SAM family heme chaperone HemW n=1 Tax=Pseudaestuariivita rosea TaxID=2763263 RepID=UPI001ABB70A7|nr:radical SAM family heme chaperone HemW [Pseudaestuariivita rosea]
MDALAEDWRNGGFGLYIHWPFCQAKCPYCDFNSHVVCQIDQARWKAAYIQEIDRFAEETPGRILNTMFFGGGTPSLMDPDVVGAIIEKVRQSWPTSNDFEITLEANPSSVEAARFAAYRDAGVNRVSVGVQALNNNDLKRLGRLHSKDEAIKAIEIAKKSFERVSFDLMYGRQDQSAASWSSELTWAIDLAADHLSLYQLTIEDGTAFGDRYKIGRLRGLPDEDLSVHLFEITQEICDKAGLHAYEVSNHAKSDAESRHNLIYWKYGDYIGIGPGAHGRLTLNGNRFATETFKSPFQWLSQVEGGQMESRTVLSLADQAAEYLMMSLRLTEGISINRYNKMTGQKLDSHQIDFLRSENLINIDQDRLCTTDRGRLVLNSVIETLMPSLELFDNSQLTT